MYVVSIKNIDLAKISLMTKNIMLYLGLQQKPQNDLAPIIIKGQACAVLCIVISLFFIDQLIYFRQNDLQYVPNPTQGGHPHAETKFPDFSLTFP